MKYAFMHNGSSHKSVHERYCRQVGHAVVEVADKVVSCSKTVGLVTDYLGFVIEPLDSAVIDGHVEPRQNILFMTSDHPRKFS